MKIPEKVKIGGKVYAVEITDKLDLGNVNYSGEICYGDLLIRICPNAQGKMEADFLHELIHSIFSHLGYSEHDEKRVDELANALHMVILDNPEIFTPNVIIMNGDADIDMKNGMVTVNVKDGGKK